MSELKAEVNRMSSKMLAHPIYQHLNSLQAIECFMDSGASYFKKTEYFGLKIPAKIYFRRKIMSQKKSIDNWKRTEYLLIKNRKKRNQSPSD